MSEKIVVSVEKNDITGEEEFFYIRKVGLELLKANDRKYLDAVSFIINQKYEITLEDVIHGLEDLYNGRSFDKEGPYTQDEVVTAADKHAQRKAIERLIKLGLIDNNGALTELGKMAAKEIANEEHK